MKKGKREMIKNKENTEQLPIKLSLKISGINFVIFQELGVFFCGLFVVGVRAKHRD